MALALAANTLGVRLGGYSVGECWRSELGLDTPSGYLTSAVPTSVVPNIGGTPVSYYLGSSTGSPRLSERSFADHPLFPWMTASCIYHCFVHAFIPSPVLGTWPHSPVFCKLRLFQSVHVSMHAQTHAHSLSLSVQTVAAEDSAARSCSSAASITGAAQTSDLARPAGLSPIIRTHPKPISSKVRPPKQT